eukprot:scaffold2931_cov71-Phaeocystis_antarctica.AAC.1
MGRANVEGNRRGRGRGEKGARARAPRARAHHTAPRACHTGSHTPTADSKPIASGPTTKPAHTL